VKTARVVKAVWLALAAALLLACGDRERPRLLSETGLYADRTTKTLAEGVAPFTPRYELWSDGAEKRRWIWLPPAARVDTSRIDHWLFPVGTRVWKEFRRDGRRLETRLIERTASGPNDYFMGSFVWDAAEDDAILRAEGAADVLGTDHDVPDARRCASCHGGEPGRVLGYSAVQLAPELPASIPGEPPAHAALGYLHANCGHCHSETGIAFREVDLILRLDAGVRAPEASSAYRTAVERPMVRALGGPRLRISPGHPEQSGLVYRMRSHEANRRMPPLGTKHVDPRGLALVESFIAALEPARPAGVDKPAARPY
jgi:hypothetical protein